MASNPVVPGAAPVRPVSQAERPPSRAAGEDGEVRGAEREQSPLAENQPPRLEFAKREIGAAERFCLGSSTSSRLRCRPYAISPGRGRCDASVRFVARAEPAASEGASRSVGRARRVCRPVGEGLALSPAAAGHAQRLDGQHRARLHARVEVHCARADFREHPLTRIGRRQLFGPGGEIPEALEAGGGAHR